MKRMIFNRECYNYIEKALIKCWSQKSNSDYNLLNPYKGQCNVTTLVINAIYGGDILKTLINNQWHYYNFINGQRIDFTIKQFDFEIKYQDILSNRIEAFIDINVAQYKYLLNNFIIELKTN